MLSPDLKGLPIMFDISKIFLENLGFKISVNFAKPEKFKTKCVAFGIKQESAISVKLNNFDIPWADQDKHLGHILYRDGSLKHDVDFKKRLFISSFFELQQELKNQDPLVLMNLIKVCME